MVCGHTQVALLPRPPQCFVRKGRGTMKVQVKKEMGNLCVFGPQTLIRTETSFETTGSHHTLTDLYCSQVTGEMGSGLLGTKAKWLKP